MQYTKFARTGFAISRLSIGTASFGKQTDEAVSLQILDRAADAGVNPLAGGLLTGKYRHDETPAKGRFSPEVGNFGAIYQRRYWHDREFQAIEKLREIAKQSGVPLATLSIGWVLANPAITSAILGASRVDQLEDTLAAVDLVLDTGLKKELDELTDEYRRGDAGR